MKAMSKIRGIIDKFVQGQRYLCALLLFIMTMITFVQVVMRFIFKAPFSWSEEMTLMLLVWFGYICMSIDIYTDSHAALYFLYNRMAAPIKKGADLLRHGILTWFFVQMVIYGITLTKLNIPKLQPATRISQGWLYAPLVVGGALMALFAFVNFVSAVLTPVATYKAEAQKEKTIDDLNVERGGTR